jgi:hypothetical protein
MDQPIVEALFPFFPFTILLLLPSICFPLQSTFHKAPTLTYLSHFRSLGLEDVLGASNGKTYAEPTAPSTSTSGKDLPPVHRSEGRSRPYHNILAG